jgi:NADPH:quinone reductase-like Zn-dependent oxidoreductase
MAALGGCGAYVDHLLIDAEKLVPTPAELSDVEAAAIPVAAMTAWHVIQAADFDFSGRRVLIHGAAGGVGGFAVQFAKAAGAIVYATASTASLPHVRALGADEVIDYRHQILDHLAGHIDLVIDLVGGEVLDRSWMLLSPQGLLVSIVAPDVVSRAPQGPRAWPPSPIRLPLARCDRPSPKFSVSKICRLQSSAIAPATLRARSSRTSRSDHPR